MSSDPTRRQPPPAPSSSLRHDPPPTTTGEHSSVSASLSSATADPQSTSIEPDPATSGPASTEKNPGATTSEPGSSATATHESRELPAVFSTFPTKSLGGGSTKKRKRRGGTKADAQIDTSKPGKKRATSSSSSPINILKDLAEAIGKRSGKVRQRRVSASARRGEPSELSTRVSEALGFNSRDRVTEQEQEAVTEDSGEDDVEVEVPVRTGPEYGLSQVLEQTERGYTEGWESLRRLLDRYSYADVV